MNIINHDDGTVDNNSSAEGTVAGGLLAGALGAQVRGDGRWIWAIPTGIVKMETWSGKVDGG